MGWLQQQIDAVKARLPPGQDVSYLAGQTLFNTALKDAGVSTQFNYALGQQVKLAKEQDGDAEKLLERALVRTAKDAGVTTMQQLRAELQMM